MKKFGYLFSAILIVFALAACGSGDEPSDGDSVTDGDGSGKLPMGGLCTLDADCESLLCFPHEAGSFCTEPCQSDPDCFNELFGACCREVGGDQKICYPADRCELVSDGDEDYTMPDGDEMGIPCNSPGTAVCNGGKVFVCDRQLMEWTFEMECDPDETCQLGECLAGGTDGDDADGDGDGDGGVVWRCGDPNKMPESLLKPAEEEWFFNPQDSNPSAKAEVYTTENPHPDLSNATYVRLNLPGGNSGPLDDQGEVQELVFDFSISIGFTYEYNITIDYVCGEDWGQVQLFLDDGEEPIFRIEDAQPREYIDLNCDVSGVYEEKPLKKIVYDTVCLEEGMHKLRVRVVGRSGDSAGFTIGVDYVMILPSFEYADDYL